MPRRAIRVTGTEAAVANLLKISKTVTRRALDKSARAGGSVLLRGEKKRTPKLNGGLRRSLIQVVRRYKPAGSLSVTGQDAAKGGKAYKKKGRKAGGLSGRGKTVKLNLVERRTKAHPMRHTLWAAGKPLVWQSGKGRGREARFRAWVRHPGTKGQKPIAKTEMLDGPKALRVASAKLTVETNRIIDSVSK